VLGAISREKGADVLEAAALLAKKEKAGLQFHLLGYAYRPLDGVIEYGAYSDADVDEKISSINPDIIWYPALWPETYSYTLSEGLRSARPIIASNLGAFPERLKGRLYSSVYDWKSSPEEWLNHFSDFMESWKPPKSSRMEWRSIYRASSEFYNLFWNGVKAKDCTPIELSEFVFQVTSEKLSIKEKYLLFLIRLRNVQGIRWVARKIPMSLQRRVKRYFSKKPIHELLVRRG